MHNAFDKEDGFIRKYGRTKYLELFKSEEKYEIKLDRIKYSVLLKINISDVSSHKCMKTKINSDDGLPLKKTLHMFNVVILIKSNFHTIYNNHYHQIFF